MKLRVVGLKFVLHYIIGIHFQSARKQSFYSPQGIETVKLAQNVRNVMFPVPATRLTKRTNPSSLTT